MEKKKIAYLPEQINIEEIKSNKIIENGIKRYSTLEINNEKIIFQTPIFEKAINIEMFKDYGDYYFIIPKNDQGNRFINFIQKLERRIIQIIYDNKQIWYPNVENVTFRSIIKNYTDEHNNGSSVIKFKIPYTVKTNKLMVDNLDNLNNGEKIKSKVIDISEGNVRMIVNLNAIWLTNNMFGIYLEPICVEEIIKIDIDYEFQNIIENVIQDHCLISTYIESEMNDNENKKNEIVDDEDSDEFSNDGSTLGLDFSTSDSN